MKSNSPLFQDPYLFHFHTTATDGELSMEEYFQFAQKQQIKTLLFLEHIRYEPDYDPSTYCKKIKHFAKQYKVQAHSGFEAKILTDGSLDISPESIALSTVVGLAEHGFPNDLQLWEQALRQAFNTYPKTYPNQTWVWVHPGKWLQKHRLLQEKQALYCELLNLAQEQGWMIEINQRYALLPPSLHSFVQKKHLVYGVDAHKYSDLQRFIKLSTATS